MSKKPRDVYWDSSVFLAWFNSEPGRKKDCREVLDDAEAGKLRIVTSVLTMTEVIKLKGQRQLPRDRERDIVQFFKQPFLVPYQVTRKIAEDARALIWTYSHLHPKDSIHLATAIFSQVIEVHSFDDKHMVKLSEKIGDPPLKITHPKVPQPNLPFEEDDEEE